MGDRCNFVFINKRVKDLPTLGVVLKDSIVLYSHWGGSRRYTDLQAALRAAMPRWNDDAYATRIIVSQIVGNNWKEETGYGLSTGTIPDNEYSILVVNFSNNTVSDFGAGYVPNGASIKNVPRTHVWSFAQFINPETVFPSRDEGEPEN